MAKEKKSKTIKQLMDEKVKFTEKVLSDLKYALMKDFTIEEACHYAGINKDTYYEWYKQSDEFAFEMETAKSTILRKAKDIIEKGLASGDQNIAKWILERRQKDIYSTKSEVESDGDIKVTFVKNINDKSPNKS